MNTRMRTLTTLFLLSAMALGANAQTLNHRATPIFGTITLRAGFTPDPHVSSVNAGGSTRNPISGTGCTGFLNASAPDLKLNYTAGSLSLTISAHAERDLSMVIRTPDGRFVCDDDSGEGLDPLITFDSPRSGEYAIWIATYSQTDQRPTSRVTISELRRNARHGMTATPTTPSTPSSPNTPYVPAVSNEHNWRGAPLFGTVTLRGGFTPDPQYATVTAGGPTRTPLTGTACRGFYNLNAPDLKLNYTAGTLPLTISATADRDLTMVIRTPDGQFLCDDDSGEGNDPLTTIRSPRSGEYAIWIGTYIEINPRPQARVTFSELGRNARYQTNTLAPITRTQQPSVQPAAASLNWQAPALFGNVTLRAGFTPDPTVSNVNAGGMDRNPISGTGCVGFLTAAAPDLKLNYTAGSLPLTISATAERDLSMVIRTPDGQFLCDDDSGEGLDPLITVQRPRTGEYAIWVATFSQSDQRIASRVTFSELGRNAQYTTTTGSNTTARPRLNELANGTSGNFSLRAGFTPDPTLYTLNSSGRFQNPVEGTGCVGWFNSADPDLKVTYTAGSLPLTFSATAERDLTMVVRAPDGTWFCDDDSGDASDPLITINSPRTGDYRIWVGPYSQTQDRVSTRITVSELGRNARYNTGGK